ncbi:MAG: hypothetical protein WBM90_01910 [Acidimicrobiia bacterium]
MSEIPESDGVATRPPATELDTPGSVALDDRDRETENERIKRRWVTAISLPVASLVVLLALVLFVDWALLHSSELSPYAAPTVAILAAAGIIVVAARGRFSRNARMSFGQLIAGTVGAGVLVIGIMFVLFSLDSGGESANVPAGTVSIVAQEFEFDPTSWSSPAGEVTFVLESAGQIGHSLTIEGMEDQLLLKVSPASEVDSASIILEEGTYTLYCDIKGHRDLGMEGTLTVTEASETDEPESS